MKLLLPFLLIASSCFSQISIQPGYLLPNGSAIGKTVFSTDIQAGTARALDTAKCIILCSELVCDEDHQTIINTFTLTAYDVVEKHYWSEDGLVLSGKDEVYWKHVLFLDRFKKPLRANVIVWQVNPYKPAK